jgi:hypothetical protein
MCLVGFEPENYFAFGFILLLLYFFCKKDCLQNMRLLASGSRLSKAVSQIDSKYIAVDFYT